MLRKSQHNNLLLQEDWNTYGEDNFIFEIIHTYQNLEESINKEQELINKNIGVGYNIGSSTNGGDLFTTNPRKEEIRAIRHEKMAGKNNHQYGKPKTKKMIDAVKKANSKRVLIEGKIYNSLTEASKELGMKINTVSYRLKSKTYSDWMYDDNKSPTTSI